MGFCPASMEVRLGQALTSGTSYKIASPSLTPTKQHFTYPFIMQNTTDLNARWCSTGGFTNDVYLDNVSVWMVAPGDFNRDRYVGFNDLSVFAGAMAAPGLRARPGPERRRERGFQGLQNARGQLVRGGALIWQVNNNVRRHQKKRRLQMKMKRTLWTWTIVATVLGFACVGGQAPNCRRTSRSCPSRRIPTRPRAACLAA